MADLNSPNDDIFVPPQYGNTFDFTLAFEHGMFAILPASLLIAIFPILLYYYTRGPVVIGYGWLFFAKIASALCLLCVEVSSLALWIKRVSTTALAIVALSLSCGAALCAAVLLGVEHRYSFRSSSVLSIYYSLTILFDIAMARSCMKRGDLGLYTQGALFITTATLRGVLLLLQEKSKRGKIHDPNLRESLGVEAISGFWNRSLFIWLNRTLFIGFRRVLKLDDLDMLGPELLTTNLSERFSLVWDQTRKDTAHCLSKACTKSLFWPALAVIVPRLCFIAFSFCQPLLLLRIVRFLDEEEHSMSSNYAYGLIGATVLIYLGIAISRAVYNHRGYSLITAARGTLVSQILIKSLTLEHSQASQNAAMTLMSADVESFTSGFPRFIEFTASLVEVGVGTYLLYTIIGNAAFLIFIPFLISTLTAQYVGKRMSPASISWNEKVQHRVSQTVLVIKHITGIKMLGLDSTIMKYLQGLRIQETKTSHKFRMLGTITVTLVNFCAAVTPVIVIAGVIFLPSSTRFSAAEAFTTISIISVVSEPLAYIVSGYSGLRMILACVQRIQAFLLLEERKDSRIPIQGKPPLTDDLTEKTEIPTQFNRNISLPDTPDLVIEAQHIFIKHQSADRYLLRDASFSIQQSTLTVIAGAVGSGKSLLLRTILGEVQFEGILRFINTGMIAYCDQAPWICNTSIRNNIIGNAASFDTAWYETVIKACFLANDFLQLPEGDDTFAGSEGVGLSGGQRQRVALARAIYSRAAIVVLDDPFSGLDQHTTRGIVSNLFGDNGILKQLKTTTIIATHSAFCAEFADAVVSLDGTGNLSTTKITTAAKESGQTIATILNVITPSTSSHIDAEERINAARKDNDTSTKEDPETLRLKEAKEDNLRRQGDLGLYLFYIRSTKRWMIILWFVAVILASLSESFPSVYVRIWLEIDAANNLYFVGYALLGLLCCGLTAFMIWFYYIHVITNSANSLHETLLNTMLRATLSYLTGTDSGVIINRFSQDINLVSRDLPRSALIFVYAAANTIFIGIVILAGARFAAAFLPLIIIVLYVFQYFYLRTSRQMRFLDLEAKAPLYTHLAETAAGIYHIRSYGLVAEVLDKATELLDISQKPFYYMFCIQRWLALGMDITALGLAAILVSFTVLQKNTSQAAIGLSLASLVSLSHSMTSIIQMWTELETSLGAIARIRNFSRDTPTEQDTNADVPKDWPRQGYIALSNVTAVYNSMDVQNEVLHNVTLEITHGQKIGIIGRTGSGKSSLLLSILNFLELKGSIYVDGRDISTISPRLLRSKVTTITQTPVSLDASVRYNLLPFQLERKDEGNRLHDEDVVEVLSRVRLLPYITAHGGLDVPMTEMGFSSGQLQTLSIARAILHNRFTNSKVVLMDEPTGNIDSEMNTHIQDVLSDAFRSCTVLIVAHRLETLTRSDMILEMVEGRIARFCPPSQIFQTNEAA